MKLINYAILLITFICTLSIDIYSSLSKISLKSGSSFTGSAQINSNSTYIVSTNINGLIKIYRIQNDEISLFQIINTKQSYKVFFNQDSSIILAVSLNGQFKSFKFNGSEFIQNQVIQFDKAVISVQKNKNCSILVILFKSQKQCVILKLNNNKYIPSKQKIPKYTEEIDISPDGNYLILGTLNYTLLILKYNGSQYEQYQNIPTKFKYIGSIDSSQNMKFIVISSKQTNQSQIYKLNNSQYIFFKSLTSSKYSKIKISLNGSLLFMGGYYGELKIFQLQSNIYQLKNVLQYSSAIINSISFDQNNGFLIISNNDSFDIYFECKVENCFRCNWKNSCIEYYSISTQINFLTIILSISTIVGAIVSKNFSKLGIIVIYLTCKFCKNQQNEKQTSILTLQANIMSEICSICLDNSVTHYSLCYHYFHKQCIQEWLKYKKMCPICRKKLKYNQIISL